MKLAMELSAFQNMQSMTIISLIWAVVWFKTIETLRRKLCDALPHTTWWGATVAPVKRMMLNFGYPKEPTSRFPNAVTEAMARDFFALVCAAVFEHLVTSAFILPVVLSGWGDASEISKILFLVGSLSEVGFDVYDGIKSTYRTFATNHSNPLPIEFWLVDIVLHHPLALLCVIPMNLNYIHLEAYHQIILALMLAAGLCYLAGNYKFTLDIKTYKGLLEYKCIVAFQLVTITYSRGYLWFTGFASILFTLRADSQTSTAFFYGGCFVGTIFSIFNILLIMDSIKAATKWLPQPMPPKGEQENNHDRRASAQKLMARSGNIFRSSSTSQVCVRLD